MRGCKSPNITLETKPYLNIYPVHGNRFGNRYMRMDVNHSSHESNFNSQILYRTDRGYLVAHAILNLPAVESRILLGEFMCRA